MKEEAIVEKKPVDHSEALARLEEIAMINAKLNEELRKEEQYLDEHYYVPVRSPRKQSGDEDSTKTEKESVLSMRSTKSNRSSLKSLMASSDVKDLTQYKEDSIEDWEDIRVISPIPTVMNIDFSDSDEDWGKSPVKVVASTKSAKSAKPAKGELGGKQATRMDANANANANADSDSEDDWETAEEKTLPPPRSSGSQRVTSRNERRRRENSQSKLSKAEGETTVEKAKTSATGSTAKSMKGMDDESDEEWEESKPVTIISKTTDNWDDDSDDEWEESKPAESKSVELESRNNVEKKGSEGIDKTAEWGEKQERGFE
ncbi:uncharacterized protein [Blastocystis hominis]|uniref:Uncharacterized protein n=1 Tax=Blastocystis hominis TaxID=12968 RepID=D8LYY4_BLAHO|nr:uncharacterized protein [Blastocystis hominis]CBK21023.2 unnamed protein product [Blastocystis hominis]|eukprot:XP_012895071.1 uncharacterized protein [Blastocystis hominis]